MSSSSLYGRLHGIFTKTTKTAVNATPKVSSPPATTALLGSSSNLKAIVRQFKRNSRSITFRSNQDIYESTVRRLASAQHFSGIESIIEEQKRYRDSIAIEGFAVRLIRLYGEAKMFDHARKLFDELPSLGCDRTVMSFNAVLSACVNSKKYDKIMDIFKEIPESLSIEPDLVSYNTVIKAFCERGDLDLAITMMNDLEKNGFEPNIVTYNTILEAYYKKNRLPDAEKLWDSMVEKNIAPNVRSYNSKLRGLVRNKQVSEAEKLIEEMEKKEVTPDTMSYNAVIKGFVNGDNLEDAKRLYGKMLKNFCAPDHITFTMLIQFACDKDDYSYALELCKKVIELNQHLYKSVMQTVVDGLVERSRLEEAKELVESVNSTSSNFRFKLEMLNSKQCLQHILTG